MRAVVEASLGRTVNAVLAAAHHDPDVMAAVFLLEPLGGSGSAGVRRPPPSEVRPASSGSARARPRRVARARRTG
jgi:hypothetical protein